MLGWTFSARTVEEVAALLRSMGRHRYVREADHALHWAVDEALADRPPFAERARRFRARRAKERELDPASRDPSLWGNADTEIVIEALAAFWGEGAAAEGARRRLREALLAESVDLATHAPFASDPEEPPHPELVLLDWEFLPIDELDAERHAGALGALELSGEQVDVSARVYVEGMCIALPELEAGARRGVLPVDFLVWSDGDYPYVDYVLRGVAKAAHLVDAPVGIRDLPP